MKKYSVIGVVLVLVLILLVLGSLNKKDTVKQNISSSPTELSTEETPAENTEKNTAETQSTPKKDSLAQKTYTLTEVSTHKDKTSCWSVVNNNVYDLTSWISRHPGGEKAILSICGKDGTTLFTGKHAGQERPEQTLASFKIGILAN